MLDPVHVSGMSLELTADLQTVPAFYWESELDFKKMKNKKQD